MLEILRRKLLLQPALDQFEVAENLAVHQRLCLLGKSQHAQQRLVCLREMVDCCFQVGLGETIRSILPLLAVLSHDTDALVRSSLFGILSDLAGYFVQADYETGYSIVCESLVGIAMAGLQSDASMLNRKDASDALIELSCHLSAGDRGSRILYPIVQALSTEKDEDQRSLLAEFLGNLSGSLGVTLASEWVVAQLCALAEDSSPKVRRSTILGICEVMKTVPVELSVRRLVPVFTQLCADTAAAVRLCCVEKFHLVVQTVAETSCFETLVALYLVFFDDVSNLVQQVSASHSGYLIALLSPSQSSFHPLLEIYSQNALKAQDFTSHYAKTFSAVLKAASATYWDSHLKSVFYHLVHSSETSTRRMLASSLAVITSVLRKSLNESEPVVSSLLTLLGDELQVSAALVRVLPEMISNFDSGNVSVILKWLTKTCLKSPNWRLRETVALSLASIVQTLAASHSKASEELVWDSLVEVWLRLVSDPVSCVRDPAADAAGALLAQLTPDWSNPPNRSVKLLAGLVLYLGSSAKASERQTFVRIACSLAACRSVPVNVFSAAIVPCLLQLATDRAAVVRTTWAREVCPLLRSAGGRFATHKELVIAAIGRLTDTDSEVARLAERVTYAPMDELMDSCPPSPSLDSALWVVTFKAFLAEAVPESTSRLALFVLHEVNCELLGS